MNGLEVNSPDIPKGIYKSTCGGCSVKDEVLTCKACMDLGGEVHKSTIITTECEYIKNENGKLVCDDEDKLPDNEMDVPLGSYLYYCGGCKLLDRDRLLYCQKCKNDNEEAAQNNVLMNLERTKCLKVSFKGNRFVCDSIKPPVDP